MQTKTTVPPTSVAEALGWYRSTPGFGPDTVTCRWRAAVRPRVTAVQNDDGVAAGVQQRGDDDGAGEWVGLGVGAARDADATGCWLPVGAPVDPGPGEPLDVAPHAAAVIIETRTRPTTRDRRARWPVRRNIGRS